MTDRTTRGLELMDRILGQERARTTRASFDEISSDFGEYIVEAGFADVYGRDGITLTQRQMINVAVLTAIGGAERQLATHINGALNVGLTPTEIVETIFHVALYAGHPRAVSALWIARDVFADAGIID
jgi:4-carboxymuconolactone decarboxylase